MRLSGRKCLAHCVTALAGGCLFGALVGSTHPFTAAADTVTGVAIGVMALVGLRSLVVRRGTAHATPGAATAGPDQMRPGKAPVIWPWVTAAAVLLAWELAVYVAGALHTRQSFPTLSSLYDEAARWHGVKAVLGALWFVLGVVLVRP